ncbi:unnamed protein product [Camellia sinensis]
MDNSTQKSSELAVEDAAPASTKSAKEVSKREGHKSDEAKTTLKKEKKINNREDDAASSQSDGDHKAGGDILDFALAFDLVMTNNMYKKREEHLITFKREEHAIDTLPDSFSNPVFVLLQESPVKSVVPSNKQPVSASKNGTAVSSSSDSEEDQDPKSKVAVPTKKVLVAAPKNKVESSDDSKSDDSSSSDDDKKIIPPTLGKKPAAVPEKAVDPSDSSSDSSSDEENGQKNNVKMAVSQPRKLPSTTVKNVSVAIVKKKDESSGSSEELLEDEDALATKLVPSKRSSSPTETKESKQEEACLKEADSDSSSEEEPQRKKMKAQPTVTPNAGKQSAKKATQNGSSSDEGSHDDEPTKAQSLRRSSPTRVAKKRSESEDECSEDNSSSEEDTSEEEHEKPSKSPNSKSPNKNDSDVDMVNAVSLKTESRQADAEFGKKVDFFKDAGEIVQIRFALDYEGAFKGYGHVEFATVAAAQKVGDVHIVWNAGVVDFDHSKLSIITLINKLALKLDGQDLLGRRVRLDLAKERGSYTSNSGMERNLYQKSGRAPGQTIFIRGFDKSSGEDQVRSALEEHFASCGGISRVTIPKNYVGDELKGVFTGENYQTWAVRMAAYLQAVDLWEAVEADYEIVPLPDNPTIQEIKTHKKRTTKKFKTKSCLHSAVSEAIFTKIMTLESAKNIWDYLRTESQGNDRSRSMQVMNLRREFEIQRMKESETIKEYSDRLLSIVNKRRLIRQEGFVEGALEAKLQIQDKSKGKKKKGNKDNSSKGNAEDGDSNNKGGTYPQCQHCNKTNHPQSKCWWRPDIKCRKCNLLGHIEKVCRSKQQREGEAKMVDQQEEEHLFVPSCYASESSNEHWLVESGCTNHMTYDKELFRKLDRTKISKVKVGNGEFIEVRGKGIVAIESVLDETSLIRKQNQESLLVTATSLKLAEFPILKQGKNEQWNWDDGEKDQFLEDLQPSEDNVDDPPVRGTRLLSDIYQRCNVAVTKPVGFEEAKNDQKWIEAMKEEMRMKEKNHTWELMEKPQNRKIIGVKWVFSTKLNANGSINKYKARLVVKGYAQIYGVDFSETIAPVARLDTIRLLLAIAAQKCWKIYQLDVKSAFLNGFLQEEIYVEQLEGFVMQGHEDKVYLLKKMLYGLKQAPRAWYSRIDSHLLSLGFVKSLSEFTPYVKEATDLIIVPVYVDDLLIIGSNEELVKEFKAEMLMVFEMTDLGLMSYFLGMEVKQRQHEVFICQQKYAKEILKKIHMEDCKSYINSYESEREIQQG